MIFNDYDINIDIPAEVSNNSATSVFGDSIKSLDMYDGTTEFIDYGKNGNESIEFNIKLVGVTDYEGLSTYLRGVDGTSVNVTDQGNVLGLGIETFDFYIHNVSFAGEETFNNRVISFQGTYTNNNANGQQFLLDIELNAYSVDQIIETLPTPPIAGTTFYETSSSYLFISTGVGFDKLPTKKDYENDFNVSEVINLPYVLYLEAGLTAYVSVSNEYYITTPVNGRPDLFEWTLDTYPTLSNWKTIILNGEGLTSGIYRFSSFYDYNDGEFDYKSGVIAKNGISVPKKSVNITKGPNVEVLQGFKATINNAERFHLDTIEYNFFGSICTLYWFDGTNKNFIRTGLNQTNTISETNYVFSVEPFLWIDKNKSIPQRMLPSGKDFVPQTFGKWDYAKLFTKAKKNNILKEGNFNVFNIVLDGVLNGPNIEIQVTFDNPDYMASFLNDANYRLKIQNKDKTFQIKTIQSNNTPNDTAPNGYVLLTMEEDSDLLVTDIVAGNVVSFVEVDFQLVIDDRICHGFDTSSGGGIEVFSYDSEGDVYRKLDTGIFKEVDDRTIGLVDSSFYALSDDLTFKALANYKSNGSFQATNLDKRTIPMVVKTPFGDITSFQVGGLVYDGETYDQMHMVRKTKVNKLKGYDSGYTGGGGSPITDLNLQLFLTFHYGYGDASGLMLKDQGYTNYPWVNDFSSVFPDSNYKNTLGFETSILKDQDFVNSSTSIEQLYLIYKHIREKSTLLNYNESDYDLSSAIEFTLDKTGMENLRGAKDVKLIGAFSFGLISLKDKDGDSSNIYAHKSIVKIILRDRINGVLPDRLLFTDTSNHDDTITRYHGNKNKNPHMNTNTPYVFCNLPKSLGGSDKFFEGLDTSEYTFCNFQGSNLPIIKSFENWIVTRGVGEVKQVVGFQISSENRISLAMVDIVGQEFNLDEGDNVTLSDTSIGNSSPIIVVEAMENEFNDEIYSGKDKFVMPDDLFTQDLNINNYDSLIVFCEFVKDGSGINGLVDEFQHIDCNTNVYATSFVEGYTDETNIDPTGDIYFSSEIEADLSGDGDALFIKCGGRVDLNTIQTIGDNQIQQMNTAKSINYDGISAKDYEIREQVHEKKTFNNILKGIAENTHSMIIFDKEDNLKAKSIDLRDTQISTINGFDSSNIIQNSVSKVKYSDAKDLATSINVSYHYHNGKDKVDKTIGISSSTDGTEMLITGLDADVNDTPEINQRKENAKNRLIADLSDEFRVMRQYYNTGRENNFDFDRKEFYLLDDSKSFENLIDLIGKIARFKLFNHWELSFDVSINEFFVNEMGDVISFQLDSINKGFPLYGFIVGMKPDFYNGVVTITLSSNVDPFLYSKFYDNVWDGGNADLDNYDVDNRKFTPIFTYNFKDPNQVGTFPDGGDVDDAGFNLNDNQFTDNTFADGGEEFNPQG